MYVCDETQMTFHSSRQGGGARRRVDAWMGDAEGCSLPPAHLPSRALTRFAIAF